MTLRGGWPSGRGLLRGCWLWEGKAAAKFDDNARRRTVLLRGIDDAWLVVHFIERIASVNGALRSSAQAGEWSLGAERSSHGHGGPCCWGTRKGGAEPIWEQGVVQGARPQVKGDARACRGRHGKARPRPWERRGKEEGEPAALRGRGIGRAPGRGDGSRELSGHHG
ncbi:hypothetical protein Zm00014a_005216 [Zea mays]|uniref:Uncharacterized protein n=1 Tax=Zea mays TaxID=4577 RepID=A0A3L6D8T1_MAIZE|nr:hypothetical protein Zm00014a_005216 [Zea mays]